MKTASRLAVPALLATALLVTGGCKSSDTSYGAVSGNLTPGIMTTHERSIDVDSHIAYTNDTNGRLFWEDLGRVFYTDHPSRLSPFPIVYTSGQPR